MAKRYTENEKKIMQTNIKDGVKIEDVLQLLPNRTNWALKRQAQLLGYGVKTIDNIEYFTEDKGTRVRTVRKKQTKIVDEIRATTNSSVSSIERTNQNISTGIIAEYKGIEAYKQAMEILKENKLPLEHEMVCILSSYILKSVYCSKVVVSRDCGSDCQCDCYNDCSETEGHNVNTY